MKFDFNNEIEVNRFNLRVESLIKSKSKVDLTKIIKPRSPSQNSYMHVLFSLFGMEFGYTLEESKTHAKRNCQFMRYEKSGEKFLKRTRDLNTKEITDFIEWFRNYSGIKGCYLPSSEEYKRNKYFIDNEIDKYKAFL